MITLSNITEKLAEAINSSELSQSEIARRLGVAHQQVSRYVSGKQLPALDTLANLCVILDLDANEILCVR